MRPKEDVLDTSYQHLRSRAIVYQHGLNAKVSHVLASIRDNRLFRDRQKSRSRSSKELALAYGYLSATNRVDTFKHGNQRHFHLKYMLTLGGMASTTSHVVVHRNSSWPFRLESRSCYRTGICWTGDITVFCNMEVRWKHCQKHHDLSQKRRRPDHAEAFSYEFFALTFTPTRWPTSPLCKPAFRSLAMKSVQYSRVAK